MKLKLCLFIPFSLWSQTVDLFFIVGIHFKCETCKLIIFLCTEKLRDNTVTNPNMVRVFWRSHDIWVQNWTKVDYVICAHLSYLFSISSRCISYRCNCSSFHYFFLTHSSQGNYFIKMHLFIISSKCSNLSFHLDTLVHHILL